MINNQNNIKKMYTAIFIFWVILILIAFGAFKLVDQETKNYLLSSIQYITQQSNSLIAYEIDERQTVLEVSARYLSTKDYTKMDNLKEWFDEIIQKNGFNRMGVCSTDGITYTNDGHVVDINHRDYFQESLKGKNYVSYLLNSPIDDHLINIYSTPIYEGSKITGVLWASVDSATFYNKLNLNSANAIGEVYFIDSNSQLIAGADTSEKNFFEYIGKQTNSSNNHGHLETMKQDMYMLHDGYQLFEYNNSKNYIFYTKINYNNWWMITKVPERNVDERSEDLKRLLIITFSSITIVCTGAFVYIVSMGRDFKKQIQTVAYVDGVTEGKNDIYLKEYLTAQNKISPRQYYLINIEINNIRKMINILGFRHVNTLIKEIYQYIEKNLSNKKDIVIHCYQGEFKILMNTTSKEQVIELITKIHNHFIHQFEMKIGVVLINSDDDYDISCSYANIAKAYIPNDHFYAFYTDKMHSDEIDKSKLEEDIERAIKNKEFKAWIQPKIGKDGQTIIGGEALARWYKYGSIIPPYIFIPICEANGLIRQIDEMVIEDICAHLKKWQEQGITNVPISVNLSRSYIDDKGLLDHLDQLIQKYDIDKSLIHFELTESALVGDEAVLQSVLKDIKDRGYRLLLDDFGVGYSSLKSIAESDFDVLKIDKSFVDGIGNPRIEQMIKYTIALAHDYNMEVLAEGVETKDQYEFLVKCNCEKFQGYYFYKPADTATFEKLLIEQNKD